MKKGLFIILVCLTALMFSCNSKQSPINELSDLAEEISENGNNYSDEDWEAAADQFEGITEELEGYNYSDEEQKEISKLKARVCFLFGSKYGKNKIKQFFNEMSGAMEELNDSLDMTNELKDLFND